MTALFLLGAALAAPAHVHSDTATLTPESLYDSVLAHFDPAMASPSLGDRFACATGVVAELKAHWDWFDPTRKAELTALVTPWKEDLLQEMPATPAPPPGAGPADTCFGQQGANRILTEHFSVEWDGAGQSWDDMEAFGAALEESWTQEVDVHGWKPPFKSDLYKTMVFVDDSDYAGAYTTVDSCGGINSAYVMAGGGIFYGDWYQDLAAHELNHASQFAYGYAHEFYFWEATATYIEEYAFPEHNAWGPSIRGYTDNTWIAMTASSQANREVFSHMYGMAILNFYLDEYVGGHALNLALWEYASAYYLQSAYSLSVPDILEALGYDWDAIYQGFVAANAAMDYREGHEMGRMRRAESVDRLPLAGESESDTAPENLGQNYWRIEGDAYDADKPDLALHLEGALNGQWLVLLVGVTDHSVERVVRAETVPGEEGEETLEAFMPDWGQHEEVWVVMSPTAPGYDSYSYAFDVWDQAVPEPVEVVDDDEGERAFLGSCSTSPATPGCGWLVLGLAGLVVRRRR